MNEFESATKVPAKPVKGALKLGGQKKAAPQPDFGWIEEEFAPIEDKTVKPASSYNWGDSGTDSSDFFSVASTGSQVYEPLCIIQMLNFPLVFVLYAICHVSSTCISIVFNWILLRL